MNYDKSKYKIYDWKHPIVLHWLINPGVAVLELFHGIRVPKVMLIERNSNKALIDRTFIPCPHCNTLHSSAKWYPQNAEFTSWSGMYCDNCGKTIPYLTNLTTYILLGITFPLWYFFKDKLKALWLKRQKATFVKALKNAQKHKWWLDGLQFGLFMFIFMEILLLLFNGEDITQKKLLSGIIISSIGGLVWGGLPKKILFERWMKKQTKADR